MPKEPIYYGIIGLVAGVLLAGFTAGYSVNHNNSGMMRAMGMSRDRVASLTMPIYDSTANGSMTTNGIMSSLKSKTGDDFDKAFINEMINHHQSAIDMANLAKQNAKHDEIKNLAKDIVTTQTKEINEMKSWQQQWGYSASTTDHGMNNMMGH